MMQRGDCQLITRAIVVASDSDTVLRRQSGGGNQQSSIKTNKMISVDSNQ